MELKTMCKIARETLELSQLEFAKLIGSNQTEVSFIERGFVPENPDKITAIKKLYHKALDINKKNYNRGQK